MIKAILFDGDGVTIKPHKYFSERLQEAGYNIPEDKIKPFFKNEYNLVAIGKADLKESIKKYLKDWNWDKSTEELLNFWFSGENEFNQDILDLTKELKVKGLKCYLTSDHSQYRADDLNSKPEIINNFDETFFSGYIGHTKEEPEFFEKVLEKINLKPEEVIFTDDDRKNVETASLIGIKALVFKDINDLKDKLSEIL